MRFLPQLVGKLLVPLRIHGLLDYNLRLKRERLIGVPSLRERYRERETERERDTQGA